MQEELHRGHEKQNKILLTAGNAFEYTGTRPETMVHEGESMRYRLVLTCALGMSGLALGQSQNLVFTQDNDEPGGAGLGKTSTAPHVGVGSSAVVVAANRRLAIYDKLATQLELWDIATSSPAYPFLVDPSHSDPRGDLILFDPQSDYDPVADRHWLLYLEGVGSDEGAPGLGAVSWLHLGVSKDPSEFPGGPGPLNTLADTHWWYYTHDSGTMTKAGAEFDVNDSGLLRYQGESTHLVPGTTVRIASMGFDEQAFMVTLNDNDVVTANPFDPAPIYHLNDFAATQYIYIVPRAHSGGSISDGDRPNENEITFIQMDATPTGDEVRRDDRTAYYRAVHEPYPDPVTGLTNQVENATFFISVGDRFGDDLGIRLRGIFDADPSPSVADWKLQQHLNMSDPDELVDMPVASALEYGIPTLFFTYDFPITPDPAGTPWTPHAPGGTFQTAVLARDTAGDFRIFAAHAVHPIENGQPTSQWVVQWYVIDPKLADFGSVTPTDWQPEIVAQGRIDNDGDAYHPVVIVNRQGQAFIEYTYSDGGVWPQIRRVRLNNSYTAVVGSEAVVRAGPSTAYDPANDLFGYWADYADAQADPFNACAYWSTHTLVHDQSEVDPTKLRDVWLFHQAYSNSVGPNCFQSNSLLDLNDDSEVNMLDMAAFTPMYDRRARRIDVDGSGTVDAIDMALYFDAFDAYTRGR